MQRANRGLLCCIPCCRWQSGLFCGFGCERTRGSWIHAWIQLCNTDLYCIVVTSWHCVLHHKLAIKSKTLCYLWQCSVDKVTIHPYILLMVLWLALCSWSWLSFFCCLFCLFCRCTNQLDELNIQSRTGMLISLYYGTIHCGNCYSVSDVDFMSSVPGLFVIFVM